MSKAVTRRRILIGVFGLTGIVLLGDLIFEAPRFLKRRYPPSPYDDLLSQLSDRDSAAKLGRASIAQMEAHTDTRPLYDLKGVADEIRSGPGKGSIVRAMDTDLAQGRLLELHGWVLPVSLVMVALMAAEVR